MTAWLQATRAFHRELSELAAIAPYDPRWWAVAAGAAAAEYLPVRDDYVGSDGEPGADTFMAYRAVERHDIAAAVVRAHAARHALRTLDGKFADQPLLVTVRRSTGSAHLRPSALDVAAFAIGDRTWVAQLHSDIEHDRDLAVDLMAVLHGDRPRRLVPFGTGPVPFVTISIGDEPISLARHGHRRGWTCGQGPWLGIGQARGLAIISTCHMVIDGYGHAQLAACVADYERRSLPREWQYPLARLPELSTVAGGIPLGMAWQPFDRADGYQPRAIAIAYALGQLLHGDATATKSPTIQVPVAPGAASDDERWRRRPMTALLSVQYDGAQPEAFAAFAQRAKRMFALEARGGGIGSRLLRVTKSLPVPKRWKRNAMSATRSPWFQPVAEVLGGRACLSRIQLPHATPRLCAVSSPAQLATAADAMGSCVVTVIDDGQRGAITVCGSGIAGSDDAAAALLTALLDRLAKVHGEHDEAAASETGSGRD